jgi:hypothetical protein
MQQCNVIFYGRLKKNIFFCQIKSEKKNKETNSWHVLPGMLKHLMVIIMGQSARNANAMQIVHRTSRTGCITPHHLRRRKRDQFSQFPCSCNLKIESFSLSPLSRNDIDHLLISNPSLDAAHKIPTVSGTFFSHRNNYQVLITKFKAFQSRTEISHSIK